MGTIAEITIPASAFALRETFEALPDVRFETVRVAYCADRAMSFVWVAAGEGVDLDAVDEALASDPSVERVTLLSDLVDERLYRLEWADRTGGVLRALVDEEATVLSAQGANGEWHLRLLFPSRESLSSAFEFGRGGEFTASIDQIYELESTERGGQFGLTEGQYGTLVTAHERGYYEIPRRITQEALADELGISRQALSERFRRGHGRLVDNTLGGGAAFTARGDSP